MNRGAYKTLANFPPSLKNQNNSHFHSFASSVFMSSLIAMAGSGQGRKKVEIKKMEKASNLQVTFSKRKSGVIKKASDLSILTGADVGVVIFSPQSRVFSFGHPNIESIADRFLSQNCHRTSNITQFMEAQRDANISELTSLLNQVLGELKPERKRGEELSQMVKKSKAQVCSGKSIKELDLPKLLQLKVSLENLKESPPVQANILEPQNSNSSQWVPFCSSLRPHTFGPLSVSAGATASKGPLHFNPETSNNRASPIKSPFLLDTNSYNNGPLFFDNSSTIDFLPFNPNLNPNNSYGGGGGLHLAPNCSNGRPNFFDPDSMSGEFQNKSSMTESLPFNPSFNPNTFNGGRGGLYSAQFSSNNRPVSEVFQNNTSSIGSPCFNPNPNSSRGGDLHLHPNTSDKKSYFLEQNQISGAFQNNSCQGFLPLNPNSSIRDLLSDRENFGERPLGLKLNPNGDFNHPCFGFPFDPNSSSNRIAHDSFDRSIVGECKNTVSNRQIPPFESNINGGSSLNSNTSNGGAPGLNPNSNHRFNH